MVEQTLLLKTVEQLEKYQSLKIMKPIFFEKFERIFKKILRKIIIFQRFFF